MRTNFHEYLRDGYLEPRKGVHGLVWVRCFQEHECAPIDTNAYVMSIWNHEMHEKHERNRILDIKSDDKISENFCVFRVFRG